MGSDAAPAGGGRPRARAAPDPPGWHQDPSARCSLDWDWLHTPRPRKRRAGAELRRSTPQRVPRWSAERRGLPRQGGDAPCQACRAARRPLKGDSQTPRVSRRAIPSFSRGDERRPAQRRKVKASPGPRTLAMSARALSSDCHNHVDMSRHMDAKKVASRLRRSGPADPAEGLPQAGRRASARACRRRHRRRPARCRTTPCRRISPR